MDEQTQKAYEKYLSQKCIKEEIVKYIQTHELSLINRKEGLYIRYLIGDTLASLEHQIYKFNILKRQRNFYISCAFHSKLPVLSDNLRTRKETPEYKNFNDNYINTVLGYDLLFDLDGKHGEDYYNESVIIKELLEQYKVPFYIISSSFTGLHIVIPYQYLPQKPIMELVDDIGNKIIPNIKSIYDLKSLDIEIMDLKKLRKVPYSPVVDGSVCLPLSDEQFKNFNKDMIRIDNVLGNIPLLNRGLLLRQYNLSTEQLKVNVEAFWKEFLE